MFPFIGQVQILGVKKREFPAKDGRPAQVVYECDFYVPGEGGGTARLWDDESVAKAQSLIGKTTPVKVGQSIYKGYPQYRLEFQV